MEKGKACLVLGDIHIDMVLNTMSLPFEGARGPLQAAELRLGGSGCVTALALHALGTPVLLAGSLGDDTLGDFALGHIQRAGLTDGLIQRLPGGQSGFFMIIYSLGGQRTVLNTRGANTAALPADTLEAHLAECAHLHISGYLLQDDAPYDCARRLAEAAFGRGLSVSLDPGVCSSQNKPECVLGLLPWISFFLPNRAELAALTGASDPDDGLRKLLPDYCGGVALKLDAEGSRYADGRGDITVPAENEVDQAGTGAINAGDGLNAGFLHAVLNGRPPREALQAGNAMAARLLRTKRGIIDLIGEKNEKGK